MRLEADDAVEDLYPGIFEIARPADVRGLVEAGHQLDHDGDFFALRRFGEGVKDGRVGAGAVERLLDGDDARILRPAAMKYDDGVVGVEGVMQQDVVMAQFFKEVVGPAVEAQLARA